MRKRFTRKERELIKRLNSPEKVQNFLKNIKYNWEKTGETIRSFRRVVKDKTAHCLEGALTAATILEHHGYEPLILDLGSTDSLDHVVYLYQQNGRYGTIGKSRCKRLMARKPRYKTVEELVLTYCKPFEDARTEAKLKEYAVVNLKDINRADYRFSEQNLWKVQNHLGEVKHKRIRYKE